MSYTSGSHTVFHHRYHIVWITKYRYKVLEGALRERIRTIIRQVCKELGVQIVSGVLSREHVRRILPSATSYGASRDGHRIGSRWSSRTCASATGGGISGLGATSPPQAATSRTMSYFSIFRSTNLPASAGSYSVVDASAPFTKSTL
jgi:putative transposase